MALGLRIKLVVPELFTPYLELMDNQSIGTAIRESMRTAARPAAVVLKGLLKMELIESDQSTGATERAVGIKYGRIKRNKNAFFVVIGIKTKQTELHTVIVPQGQRTKLRKGKDQRGAGLYAVQYRADKKGKVNSKQVFSRYRNQRKIKKLNGGVLKRSPSRYFHLIDKGFNHRLGVRAKAYMFIQKLHNSVSTTMQSVFEERLRNIIVPVIKKEIARKLKRVLR